MNQRLPSLWIGVSALCCISLLFGCFAAARAAAADLDHAASAHAAQQKAKGQKSGGPSFCRSGAGHPVYGRQWCLEKGFRIGDGPLWRPLVFGEIVFGRTPRGRLPDRPLGWQEIAEILSHTAVDILFDQIGAPDDRQKISGRWRGGEEYGVFVLELMDGDEPLAELNDTDGDGRVDVVIAPENL
jgi:hypothetical protein